ncbi:MAG TPA: ABC transporter permease subunit [Terriglobia bacterium]|nr:ABC transporter permease subunit [Terriglobia bacterium]
MKQETPPPAESTIGTVGLPPPVSPGRSASVFRRRLRKFTTLKRGYYAFLFLAFAYAISFALPLLINNKALAVRYQGNFYFPILRFHPASEFGMEAFGEPNYRELKKKLAEENKGDWVLMPPYPYSPTESLLDLPGTPPHEPSREHIFGTDTTGRDVFARLAYGFNISLSFAVLVLIFAYGFGIFVGAMLGYFGSITDILGQRVIEIWSSLPFLYTIIIISSIVVPIYTPGRNLLLQQSFWLLIGILAIFDWMNITYYVRGEFYREKAKDYVGAAIAMGVSEPKIIFKHILPNALTPIVSFAPFTIVANISALVALDFLGFGLPAPTPSWGELIGEGVSNLTSWWLVFFPIGALFLTLLLIVLIGESVRDAFDPKDYSRLR